MNLIQNDVKDWLLRCFNEDIASNTKERNFRFLEEALELVQANGCSREDALRLVDYVYNRPSGELNQEVGGTVFTLAALCNAAKVDLVEAFFEEFERVNTPEMIEKIRQKQIAKGDLSIPFLPEK